jgi:hypothetical protein
MYKIEEIAITVDELSKLLINIMPPKVIERVNKLGLKNFVLPSVNFFFRILPLSRIIASSTYSFISPYGEKLFGSLEAVLDFVVNLQLLI